MYKPAPMLWLLAGYMWLFVHRPFEVWPALGDYHVERAYMIGVLVYWALMAPKTWTSNRLNLAFACLAVSVLLSAMCSPLFRGDNLTVENWLKISVFYLLVVSTVSDEEDLRFLLIAFLCVMTLYNGHSLREFLAGRHVYRMGVARMVGVDQSMGDPNAFGATVLFSLPMVYPLWYEARKRWHKALLVGYLLLSGVCILLTGSRSAFVGLLVLAAMVVPFSKHRWTIALALVLAMPVVWLGLREDLKNRYLTLVDPSAGPTNAEGSAEGRIQGFWDGIRNWQEHPVTGVGPGCHALATGHGFQAHNLYGQVLGEIGTLGAVSFLFVVAGFTLNTIETRRLLRLGYAVHSFPTRVIAAVFAAVLLLLVLGWGGHNLFRYSWLWYGSFQAIALRCVREQADQASFADEQENEDSANVPAFVPLAV
jgi:O-antigen ligase